MRHLPALLLTLSVLVAQTASAQGRPADSPGRNAPPSGGNAIGVQAGGAAIGAPDRRLVRGDVGGSVAWLAANKSELDTYNDWLSRGAIAGAAFGWYWTNHWKTSVDGGWGNTMSLYAPIQERQPSGQQLYGSREWTFRRARLGVLQQYQFRNNEWFHPFAGFGVEVVRERTTRRDDAIYVFDPLPRGTVIVRPEQTFPPESDWKAFAAAAAGFKWYFARRGFISSEVRATFRDRPEEVILRLGAGVDF